MTTFIELSDIAFSNQLDIFCGKLDVYAAQLELDTQDIASLKQTNTLVQFLLKQNNATQQFALTYTAYKNLLRYGQDNQSLGAIPVLPAYPEVLPAVGAANAQKQFADMIQECVRSKNFTASIGQDLGIIKTPTVFDPEAGAPLLSIKAAQGGHPVLHSKIGSYEAFEIWKDSNDNQGFKLTGSSMHPDYLDLTSLPPNGVAVTWKYKAIYIYKGRKAGGWSNEVSVTVHGNL